MDVGGDQTGVGLLLRYLEGWYPTEYSSRYRASLACTFRLDEVVPPPVNPPLMVLISLSGSPS